MLPGFAAPALISPLSLGPPVRRKLVNKQQISSNTSYPARDIYVGLMSYYIQRPLVRGGRLQLDLSSGDEYAHIAAGGTFGGPADWKTMAAWVPETVLMLGANMPDGVDLPYGSSVLNLRWSSSRETAGNLVIPTSTMVRKNSIAVAAVSSGTYRKVSMTWGTGGSGESFDIGGSRSADYGTCSIIRMALFADGPPAYDITVGFGSAAQQNCMVAIMEWDQ